MDLAALKIVNCNLPASSAIPAQTFALCLRIALARAALALLKPPPPTAIAHLLTMVSTA